MDVRVGDKLVMKKNHPCGCNTFDVLRSGMDFKIKCEKCGHEVMVRKKIFAKLFIPRRISGSLKKYIFGGTIYDRKTEIC